MSEADFFEYTLPDDTGGAESPSLSRVIPLCGKLKVA
jgi:hypothetical protein